MFHIKKEKLGIRPTDEGKTTKIVMEDGVKRSEGTSNKYVPSFLTKAQPHTTSHRHSYKNALTIHRVTPFLKVLQW